jgi:hypothetical protein
LVVTVLPVTGLPLALSAGLAVGNNSGPVLTGSKDFWPGGKSARARSNIQLKLLLMVVEDADQIVRARAKQTTRIPSRRSGRLKRPLFWGAGVRRPDQPAGLLQPLYAEDSRFYFF